MMVDFCRGRWSPATRMAYRVAWRDFEKWCDACGLCEHQHNPLPADPETIADFLRARADTHSTSSLSTRLAAIVAVHALYGHEVKAKGSVIRDAWAEIRRIKGTAKQPKAALTADDIKRIVRGMPAEALQDRAVVLFAFASLMRRSELVALNREDLTFADDALTIVIWHSKTDKTGKGATIAVRRSGTEFCPVAALERWLEASKVTFGPVFQNRSGGRMDAPMIATIAKRWAKNAGYDPRVIGAHSFRRGGITTMFRNGAKIEDIMRASRHATVQIALGYVEAQRASLNPAIAALGL